MLVTLFSSLLQVSFRSDYFFLLIDRHCEENHRRWLKYLFDHDWRWKFQSKCDRREEINAKQKMRRRKQKIYAKAIEMRILLRILISIECRRHLQINMMKRSISRAKQKQKQNDIDFANVCCFKLLEFELFEFLLIDAFWLTADSEIESMNTTHWRRTNDYENDEFVWLNIKSIDSYSSTLHVIALISLCNRFIFFDVDCEDVKNRTHAYWNRFSRLTENFIEADSLVVVANSLSVVEADRHWDRRNEAKFKFFWFDVLSVDLFVKDKWFDVCDFYLFLY